MSMSDSPQRQERSPSASSASTSENIIFSYFEYLSYFSYDKAKTVIEKYKESKENTKLWTILQSALIQLIYAEKAYNNIQYIGQKASIKDKTYESAISGLEQILKDSNLSNSSISSSTSTSSLKIQQNPTATSAFLDINNFIELVTDLLHFIDFRLHMMNIYTNLKEKDTMGQDKHANLNHLLISLVAVQSKFQHLFMHPYLDPLKNLYNLEISLIKNLLECHLNTSSDFNCIQSVVNLKIINDIFNKRLFQMNTKQLKETKGFFFNRQTPQKQTPVLYQWFKMYYTVLANKLSIYMHDSFCQIIPNAKIVEMDYIMNEKIDLYSKIVNFVKKFNAYLSAVILDTNSVDLKFQNYFAGNGYELIKMKSAKPQGADTHPFVFSFPKLQKDDYSKHKENMKKLMDSKVKFAYDPTLKSTYYVSQIEDNWTFCIIFELNKTENKAKTQSFVQEICEELNLQRTYQLFNANLK